MYGEPVMLGLDCYAKSVGKEVDDLTDEEIHTIVEKVAGVIDETLIETVMQGQQVPAIFGISKKIPQHEDFTEQLNQDKINFYNKWTHCKTKLGAPLFFSELSEDESTNIELEPPPRFPSWTMEAAINPECDRLNSKKIVLTKQNDFLLYSFNFSIS